MLDDRLATAVAGMFAAFARFYGARWRATHDDERAIETWAHVIRLAGLSPADVRRGVAAASQLKFPPTTGEFIELCRVPVPSLREALREACGWAREVPMVAWSHPAIGAAAHVVGTWALTHEDQRELSRRFDWAYRDAVARINRGEDVLVPIPLALPAPKREAKAAPSAEGRAEIARICGMLRIGAES